MKKFIIPSILIISFIILGIIIYGYQVITTLQTNLDFSPQNKFVVNENDSWDNVLDNLKEKGILNKTIGAKSYLSYKKFSPKPGEYTISSKISFMSFFSILNKGLLENNKEEIEITIKEGLSIDEIAAVLGEKTNFSREEFLNSVDKFDAKDYEFIRGKSLEGYLFPDTYRFFQDVTPDTVITRMLDTFEKKALPYLKNKDEFSDYQVLILASIIEKEVQNDSERKIVSGIFWNRLKIDMPLQSDATINFITKSGRAQSTLKDLEIDSKYNTYKYKGLPPTPISNMGISSIEAAVNPTDTKYLFFLTTLDIPYTTYFSETYEQHVQFKKEFLDNK